MVVGQVADNLLLLRDTTVRTLIVVSILPDALVLFEETRDETGN